MAFRPKQLYKRAGTPQERLEDEIRVGVFDQGNVPHNGDPQLIVPNGRSGCYGLYFITPEGVEFIFHHAIMKFATTCGCLTKMKPGESTMQISAELDEHRLRLIRQRPYRLGPKLAAMVIMKLFVGLEVPEVFRMKQDSETVTPDIDPEALGTQ
ncbi:hypothetical protein F4805DRAFT_457023 [Annulohypoxylon moriforme]|nr:hypothetical protein F4805DRAFT_457023 [Annulohypoxylon moriforme]